MSILIVEDNPVSARMLEISLQKGGYQTLRARTGKEGLEKLEQLGTEIQMVITDVMMPDMDGLQLIRAMKENPELKGLPVIVTTSLADMETVAQAAKLGCEHYIVKPIKTAQVLQKIRQIVESNKAILRNRFKVMQELDLSTQAYNDFAKPFAEQIDQIIQRLDGTANSEVPPELFSNLSALQESAALIGAERLAQTLERLRGATETNRSNMLSKVLEELKLLRGALKVAAGE